MSMRDKWSASLMIPTEVSNQSVIIIIEEIKGERENDLAIELLLRTYCF